MATKKVEAPPEVEGTAIKYVGISDYRIMNDVTWIPQQVIILDDEVAAFLVEVHPEDFEVASDDEASESLLALVEDPAEADLPDDVDTSDASTESGTDA